MPREALAKRSIIALMWGFVATRACALLNREIT